VVGLTGGIASGKSTVAAMFAELGAAIVDADVIAREVLERPAVCEQIRSRWGEAMFDADGRPDRKRIADVAFGDPARLAELNGWIHPPTREEMGARLARAARAGSVPLIVIDAPLLLEGDLDEWCHRIVFVEADAEVRAARARTSRCWDCGEIDRRESAQDPIGKKRGAADAVIRNNGTLDETRAQVRELFRRWTERPQSAGEPVHLGGRKRG